MHSIFIQTPPSKLVHPRTFTHGDDIQECNSNECDEIFNLMIRWFSSLIGSAWIVPVAHYSNRRPVLWRGLFHKIGYLCSIESFQIRFNYTVFLCVHIYLSAVKHSHHHGFRRSFKIFFFIHSHAVELSRG